ncbi:MAG: hypothetical protein JNG88_17000 [Phycisphaerales bacterium]|nr:hypothetical protein [Phycisphaerales bacterium]
MPETREIDRFPAQSADGGFKTTIVIYQSFIEAPTFQNPGALIPGLEEARTIDGYACKRINGDEFEVVDHPLHQVMTVRRIS